jgi:hypothetical protein
MNDMGVERWAGIAAGLTVGLAVLYFLYGPRIPDGFFDSWFESEPEAVAEAPLPDPEPAPAPAPQRSAEPVDGAARYPIPETVEPAPAPAPAPKAEAAPPVSPDIAASDAEVRAAAANTFGGPPVESLLIPDRIIQNFVATVDSLDREPIPLRFRVLQNVPEVPVVEKKGDKIYLDSDNDERYRLFAESLRAADARSIANFYIRYYPLLQHAYRELGYPSGHFNDRLVQVIDHLLQTPTVEHPIELVRGKVLYHYADPALEELSSGQKLLIRIGPANATAAKQRLRELREIITSGKQLPATTRAAAPPAAPAPARQPAAAVEPTPPLAAPAEPETAQTEPQTELWTEPEAEAAAMEANEPEPAAEQSDDFAPNFAQEPAASQEITPVPPLRELEEGKERD